MRHGQTLGFLDVDLVAQPLLGFCGGHSQNGTCRCIDLMNALTVILRLFLLELLKTTHVANILHKRSGAINSAALRLHLSKECLEPTTKVWVALNLEAEFFRVKRCLVHLHTNLIM